MAHRASPIRIGIARSLKAALTAALLAGAGMPALGQEDTPGADPLEDEILDEGNSEGDDAEEAGAPAETVDPRILLREEEARRERIDRLSRSQPSIVPEGSSLTHSNLPRYLQPPSGLRLGRFIYSPRLTVSALYTDNANSDDNDPESDTVLGANASLRADALLRRHAFGAEASVGSGYALDGSEDDSLDWQVLADGRYDLTRQSSLNAEVSGGLSQESDRSADAEDEDDITVGMLAVGAGYTFVGRRWDFSLNAVADREDFSGEGTADRDVTVYSLSGQVVRRLSDAVSVFASPQASVNEFDDVEPGGQDRDSIEASGAVGVDFQASPRLSLAGSVGYSRTFFEDSSENDDDSGVIGTLAADYIYDARTDLQLSASRGFDISTVDGATTQTTTQATAQATRLLSPGHTASVEASYVNNDFENGADRVDHDVTAALSYYYQYSPNLIFNVGYQYFTRFSDESDNEFDENQVFFAVSVAY